jgi:UPF0716 protein FxsA
MFRVLFLLFIIIPIIEISVLMQVGELLGIWPTIGIVILSAWIGAKYVRQQGLATLQSVQAKMAQGEMPSSEIVTGLMLLVAGVLLVTPGFVTDIFGLSLLVPSVRTVIATYVQKHINVNAHVAGNHAGASSHTGNTYENEGFSQTPNPENKGIPQHQSETIDGEYTRKE